MSNVLASVFNSSFQTYTSPLHHDQLLGWCGFGTVLLYPQTLLLSDDGQPRAHHFVCEIRIVYPILHISTLLLSAISFLGILRFSDNSNLHSVSLLWTTSCHQQTLPSPCLPSFQVIYECVEQQSSSTDPWITPPMISLCFLFLPSVPLH